MMATARPSRSFVCTETPSPAKELLRSEIAEHIRRFEAAGGRPQEIPIGVGADYDPRVWVNSLGKLTKAKPAPAEPPANDEVIGRQGSGRQPRRFKCRQCHTTDESQRVPDRHLCRKCSNAADRERRQQISDARSEAGRHGHKVLVAKIDEYLIPRRHEFISMTAAGRFLGVTPAAISLALRGRREAVVRGWTVRRQAEDGGASA